MQIEFYCQQIRWKYLEKYMIIINQQTMQQSDIETNKYNYEGYTSKEYATHKKQKIQAPKIMGEPSKNGENFYIQKLSSHLAFMEIQLYKNLKHQKKIIQQIQKECIKKSPSKSSPLLSLYLSQTEEAFLKNLLLKHTKSPSLSQDLITLVELAMVTEKGKYKNQFQQISKVEKNQIYPSIVRNRIPHITSMKNLPSEKERKQKLKVIKDTFKPKITITPLVQSIMRTPQSNENMLATFSAKPMNTDPLIQFRNTNQKTKQVNMHESYQLPESRQVMQASIAKRLNWQDQERYFGWQWGNNSNKSERQSDKMSLNYSISNGQKEEPITNEKIVFRQIQAKSIIQSELEEVQSQYTRTNNNIFQQKINSPQKYFIKDKKIQKNEKEQNIFIQNWDNYPRNLQNQKSKIISKAETNLYNQEHLSWESNAIRHYKRKEKPIPYSIRRSRQS